MRAVVDPDTGWRAKLHPAFFEAAAITQEFERKWRAIQQKRETELCGIRRRDKDRRKEIDQRALAESTKLVDWCSAQLRAVQDRYGDIQCDPRAFSYLRAASGEPETVDPFIRFLHWMRHRRSLTMTWTDMSSGSLSAVRHLARTVEDRIRVLIRRERIKPFKGDEVHRLFLEMIICFQQQPLTPQERADCADIYCGCELREHDVDALRKQYTRLLRELDAAWQATQQGEHSSQKGSI